MSSSELPFAPTLEANGARIPRIGLGTWPMKDAECIEAVSTALQIGYRHVDTARMYGNETEVGEGLRASGIDRDDVFVTTKVWHDDIAPGDLQRSAEGSLKRLGLDQVDLLLIHWPNRAVPIKDAVGALCDAKRQGFARNIGISNFTTVMIDEAVAAADEPLVCNQIEYHPQLSQTAVIERTRAHGMAVVSYCPLGRPGVGGLIGEATVTEMAKRHDRSPGQILLRWQMQQDGIVAVPKSSNPGRLRENLDVFDFELTDEDMAALSGLARPDGRIVSLAFAPDWDN
jgi:diketogulonate reductase-like aldo/keto reductase